MSTHSPPPAARHLLKPMHIRGLTLPDRILMAPLAGYGNLPYRIICWRYGRPALLATEMISARGLRQGGPRTTAYLAHSGEEGPVQYQIWGTDPAGLGEATHMAAQAGAAAVDLNCGCPVRKILAGGAGVALMRHPDHIGRCVAVMREATGLPLSVKLRLGPDSRTSTAVDCARAAEDAGADFVTVHGRFGREAYNVPVRAQGIAHVVAAVGIPVVANGDVRDGPSATRLAQASGADAVMVGRACLGNPWAFARIRCELAGGSWSGPTPQERARTLLDNFSLLADFMGEARAVRHVRKLAAFYSKSVQGAREFREGLSRCTTARSFVDHVHAHFHVGSIHDRDTSTRKTPSAGGILHGQLS